MLMTCAARARTRIGVRAAAKFQNCHSIDRKFQSVQMYLRIWKSNVREAKNCKPEYGAPPRAARPRPHPARISEIANPETIAIAMRTNSNSDKLVSSVLPPPNLYSTDQSN